MGKEPADPGTAGHLGVRDTRCRTPRPVRVLLAGVLVNRLAGFRLLFLTDHEFSAGQTGLLLVVLAVVWWPSSTCPPPWPPDRGLARCSMERP